MTSANLNNDNLPPITLRKRVFDRLEAITPLTFRGQAVLFLIPMIVIISTVYTVESIYTERNILRNEIIKKGETIATIAARNAELPVLSENLEQLKSSALSVMAIKDVAYVSFLDKSFEILIHEGKKVPKAASQALNSGMAISFSEHDNVFEFTVPVVTVRAQEGLFLLEDSSTAPAINEHIGWVRIGLSKEVMSESVNNIMVRGAILLVVFSTAGTLLLYMFVTLATRPLYALINAVKEVRKGGHSEVVVTSPKSEIGRLSSEFNRMILAIRDREEALQENVLELEITQNELQENVQELEMQIDAREAAEVELIKYRDHLEDLVVERTTALSIAKDQAESANRAKSDFISSMSHELRTPLNAILGYTQILKHQTNLTETQRQHLEVMRSSGEHLLTLINDILDVGKIEACKMEIEDIAFDLPALVRQVLSLTKLRAEEKELLFQYETETTLPLYVRGDERKLKQILLNLLSNAVNNTRRGGVTLRVSYGLAGAGIFRCDVVDTGVGIPSDKLEMIFEPFTQLVSDKQVREGTGLGLNISKRLLEMMQGRIGVESVPGKGSTFWIEVALPTLMDSDASPEKMDYRIVGYEGDRKKVLVVDDTIGNTSMLVSLLEPLGFEIDTAQNGQEAVFRAKVQRPDLVLLDLVMPEMDGLEAATLMRHNMDLSNTRIIGASATATDNAHKEAFVAICDDFVLKPIRIDLLLEKIRMQLGIEWKTEINEISGTESIPRSGEPDDTFVLPAAEEIEELHELALMGDMLKIEAWAAELELKDARFRNFAEKLRELAGGFKTRALLALVEQYREGKNDSQQL